LTQLGQYALAADSIRVELKCPYIQALEDLESKGESGRTEQNISMLHGNSTESAPKTGGDSPWDYNVPAAALMIHAELPYGLHKDANLVIERVQALMREIDDHASRLDGAESGTVGCVFKAALFFDQ